MKLRYLILPYLAFCMISSCSSCGENKPEDSTGGSGDGTLGASDSALLDTIPVAENTISDEEQLRLNINALATEQLALAKSSRSNRVKKMLAGFDLGMTKREVGEQVKNMMQKKILLRIQKGKNLFEYVYPLPLKSGKANTQFNFTYTKRDILYQAKFTPLKFRRMHKNDFVHEIRDLLTDWYGAPSFSAKDAEGHDQYIWINGNRHIDLHCTKRGAEFIFTDMRVKVPKGIEIGKEEPVM